MKRRLFSVALCVFALLLLMGAEYEPDTSAVLIIEEESAAAEAELALGSAIRIELEQGEEENGQTDEEMEAVPSEDASAAQGEAVPAVEAEVDRDEALLVDGRGVSFDTSRTVENGVTWVALSPMARELLPQAQSSWDGQSRTVRVETEALALSAVVGEQYLVANGRYLYVPETVQLRDGRVMVPLRVLAKALDAQVEWDGETGVTRITSGSGAITPGEDFYDQNLLFWLSRVIATESGNQPLKGRMAVGNVLLNRLNSPAFPNTIEAVLAQKNQFFTYGNGKLAAYTPGEGSVIAAKLVLDGGVVEETRGALYFDSAVNSWASRNRTYIATLGGHKFFQ